MIQSPQSIPFGCDKAGIRSDQMVACLSFLKVRRRFFLTLSALLAVKLSSTSYGKPLQFKKLQHTTCESKYPFQNHNFRYPCEISTTEWVVLWNPGFYSTKCIPSRRHVKDFCWIWRKITNLFSCRKHRWVGRKKNGKAPGQSLLYILDSVHPGLKITFER